jgi:multiple sugar transport system permease protein
MSVRKAKRLLGLGARTVAIVAAVLWSAFPIFLVVSSSFKEIGDIFAVPTKMYFKPTTENYVRLWHDWPTFFDSMVNSAIITVGATFITILSGTMAGWVYSRYSSRLLTVSAFGMIVLRLFPPIVITLPLFPLANLVGLNDTHIFIMVLYASFFVSLATWIMKAFFDQIPREIEQAAQSDGASFRQTLLHVSFPLGIPGMIAAGVFVFIYSWNEYFFPFIFTTSHAKTAPVVLSEIMGSATGVDWGVLFAAATIQLVPIAVFMVVIQKFLILGLTAGSVKG